MSAGTKLTDDDSNALCELEALMDVLSEVSSGDSLRKDTLQTLAYRALHLVVEVRKDAN